ncbi:unnamed protein product [Amoebophrya sp. A25]|nr:unnamed protein product [Amoebophrya sp. A25]|eukprot:GSA25T00023806001.1
MNPGKNISSQEQPSCRTTKSSSMTANGVGMQQEQVGGSSPSRAPKKAMDLAKFPDEKLRELIVKSLERTKRAEKHIQEIQDGHGGILGTSASGGGGDEGQQVQDNSGSGGNPDETKSPSSSSTTNAESKEAAQQEKVLVPVRRESQAQLQALQQELEQARKDFVATLAKKRGAVEDRWSARLAELQTLQSDSLRVLEDRRAKAKLRQKVKAFLAIERKELLADVENSEADDVGKNESQRQEQLVEEKEQQEQIAVLKYENESLQAEIEGLDVEITEVEKEIEENRENAAAAAEAAQSEADLHAEAAASAKKAMDEQESALRSEIEALEKQIREIEEEIEEQEQGGDSVGLEDSTPGAEQGSPSTGGERGEDGSIADEVEKELNRAREEIGALKTRFDEIGLEKLRTAVVGSSTAHDEEPEKNDGAVVCSPDTWASSLETLFAELPASTSDGEDVETSTTTALLDQLQGILAASEQGPAANLGMELEGLVTRLPNEQSEVTTLLDAVDKKHAIKAHRKILNSKFEEFEETEKLIRNLEQERDRLDGQLRTIATDFGGQRERIEKSTQEEMQKLESEKLQVCDEKDQLREQLKTLEQQKEKAKDEMSCLKEDMATSNEALELSQKETADLSTSLEKVAEQVQITKQNLRALREEDRLFDDVMDEDLPDVGDQSGETNDENAPASPDADQDKKETIMRERVRSLMAELKPLITVEVNMSTGEDRTLKGYKEGADGAAKKDVTSPSAGEALLWHYLFHEKRKRGYWIDGPELQGKLQQHSLSIDDFSWPLEAMKPVQGNWIDQLESMQKKVVASTSGVDGVNEKINNVQAEFLQFRQNTATSLQINSSLRAGIEEASKTASKMRMDMELMHSERDTELKRKEENMEEYATLLAEKEDRAQEERTQDLQLEKLAFDIENEQFQLQKRSRIGVTEKANDALEEETKKQELLRLREVSIPPLEEEVQALRTAVHEKEKEKEEEVSVEETSVALGEGPNKAADGQIPSKTHHIFGKPLSASDIKKLGAQNPTTTGSETSSFGGAGFSNTNNSISDIRDTALFAEHNLLAERKRKLFRLPVQAYTLQADAAAADLLQLRSQIDSVEKKLDEQRDRIQRQYEEILENKRKFREVQGLYLTPTKELEYVQNVFRKYVATLPASHTKARSLLPVMHKFFNVDVKQDGTSSSAGPTGSVAPSVAGTPKGGTPTAAFAPESRTLGTPAAAGATPVASTTDS